MTLGFDFEFDTGAQASGHTHELPVLFTFGETENGGLGEELVGPGLAGRRRGAVRDRGLCLAGDHPGEFNPPVRGVCPGGGIFTIAAALAGRTMEGQPWWALLIDGLLGIAVGIVAFAWPGITALALLYLIAFWAILTGVLEVIAAIRLRKEIEGEWLLAISGVLSVLFGLALDRQAGHRCPGRDLADRARTRSPSVRLMIVLGFRMRSWSQFMIPGGAAPRSTPA